MLDFSENTRAKWAEFIEAMYSGEVVKIDEETFDYFLDVLPPRSMRKIVPVQCGKIQSAFTFAEGYDVPVAFFRGTPNMLAQGYYCQRTTLPASDY